MSEMGGSALDGSVEWKEELAGRTVDWMKR